MRVEDAIGVQGTFRRRDLLGRQKFARFQCEHIQTAADFRRVDPPLVPIGRPVTARNKLILVDRPAVEIGDFVDVLIVGEVDHADAALIPRLHKDIAPGNGDDRSVMGNAVFLVALRRRKFVGSTVNQFAVLDSVERVRAPVFGVAGLAARPAAPAPFVGE